MLNHKTIFKQKSKILLTIICIFGLAFSYSCSCRSPEKPPSGGGNFSPKANPSSQLSLIASEDGTAKTEVAISFYEENSHNIKSAKATKIVDDKGNDITDKATYVFSDGKFSFIKQSDLQGILTGMDSTSKPATNTLTVTFEITTDSTEVLNTTATVDVNVYLVKTQKFDNQATILQDIIKGLGGNISASKRVQFDFTKAGIELIEAQNIASGGNPSDCNTAEFLEDIINGNPTAITRNESYKIYFDGVEKEIIGTVDGNSPNLNFKLTFTPKIFTI